MTPRPKKSKSIHSKSRSKPESKPGNKEEERRRADRRQILENFSVFLVIPSKGSHRLQVTDLSETGMGFYLDIENESPATFPMRVNDKVDLKLYVNATLHIPLNVKVIWIETKKSGRFIGAEFLSRGSAHFKALLPLLQLLDSIVEADKEADQAKI
jgi:hypothetical protein